jgi:hypothetical protein
MVGVPTRKPWAAGQAGWFKIQYAGPDIRFAGRDFQLARKFTFKTDEKAGLSEST